MLLRKKTAMNLTCSLIFTSYSESKVKVIAVELKSLTVSCDDPAIFFKEIPMSFVTADIRRFTWQKKTINMCALLNIIFSTNNNILTCRWGFQRKKGLLKCSLLMEKIQRQLVWTWTGKSQKMHWLILRFICQQTAVFARKAN